MSNHLEHAIRTLEQELESHQQSCHEYEQALIPLRRLAGATPRTAGPDKAIRERKAPRPEPAGDSTVDDRIVKILRSGPQPTKAIAVALKQDPGATKRMLTRLKKTGAVVQTGWSRGAKWSLAEKSAAVSKPAKEAP